MGKKGPPYLDDPSATYIVIDHPWGQTVSRNSQSFIHSVGAWVRFMSRRAGDQHPANDVLVNTIYTRKTEDFIIVGLPEDIPLEPYLGEHRWSDFLNLKPQPRGRSLVFEYDYRNNGDPSNHNWTEHYPRSDLPPLTFPVRIPYPSPGYAVRPGNLISLTKPMARPAPPPRVSPPPCQPSSPPPPPPPLLPPRQPSPSPSPPPPPSTSTVVKVEEEDVKPVIKIEDMSGEIVKVKDEPVDAHLLAEATYQPSEELLRLAESYIATQGRTQERHVVKAEPIDVRLPPNDNHYQPSEELLRLATSYNNARRKRQEEAKLIKPEPVEVSLPPSDFHYRPNKELVRLRGEGSSSAPETKQGVPSSARPPSPSYSRDPRKRAVPSSRVKVEEDEDHVRMKRMKVEPDSD